MNEIHSKEESQQILESQQPNLSSVQTPIIQKYIDQKTLEILSSIENDFFNKKPLEAIKRYNSDIIEKINNPSEDDQFIIDYVNIIKARQYSRLAHFQEAHQIIEQFNPRFKDQEFIEINKSTILYLEWVLVAKKIYYKQLFQQQALELLQNAVKIINNLQKLPIQNELTPYLCKIYEGMGNMYAEVFLYQTGKDLFLKSQKLRLQMNQSNSNIQLMKFNLKFSAFYKKSGFYWKALQILDDIENILQNDQQKYETNFIFRVLREKARIYALINKPQESQKYFQSAKEQLGTSKENNIKFAKLFYLEGLALKRISLDKSIETFNLSLKYFKKLLENNENIFMSQIQFEIGQILKKQEKFEEAQQYFSKAGLFIRSYFNDEKLYGNSSGGNHPLMQQYFLMQIEWAQSKNNTQIEKQMLKKYLEIVNLNNQTSQNQQIQQDSIILDTQNKRSIFLLEAVFQELQAQFYSKNEGSCNSNQLKEKIKEMDMIQYENGMLESQQYINWSKVFLAMCQFQEGDKESCITTLEETIEQYSKTLDDDIYHPFLESFYQQIGNMYFQTKNIVQAQIAFEKLVKCKERLYGENSKEVIAPIMQLQHTTSASNDIEKSLERSLRANELLNNVIQDLDNNLVLNQGITNNDEHTKQTVQIMVYKKYKIDVLFNLYNLSRIKGDYTFALQYAQEHTKVNKEVFQTQNKNYSYALLLEAQCMCTFKNLDQKKTLETVNKALNIQLQLLKNKMDDTFLGRVYEEKGHVYMLLSSNKKDEYDENNVRALQCFNSSQAILQRTQELQRLEIVEKMIQELEQNEKTIKKLKVVGKYDIEFLNDEQKLSFIKDVLQDENFMLQEDQDEFSSNQLIMLATAGIIIAGAAYSYFKYFRQTKY